MSKIINKDQTDIESRMDELIRSFLSGKSKQTVDSYRADLKIFSKFLNCRSINEASSLLFTRGAGEANSIVLRFKNWLVDYGYSPNTVNRRLASIRSLVKLARIMGLITFEVEVQNQKVIVLKDTRGHQNPEIQKILKSLSRINKPRNIRDIAIIRLLHDLALRASELTSLDINDYNQVEKSLAVLGKGMKEKIKLTLPEATNNALLDWLDVRDANSTPLFYSLSRSIKERKRLTRQGLRLIVIKLAKNSGVTPKTTHSWRHSSITQALIKAQEKGYGLEVVLDHSRHSKNSINLLMTYRDRFHNVQGKIANMVADELKAESDE
jgi:integrase/recombinase XerC